MKRRQGKEQGVRGRGFRRTWLLPIATLLAGLVVLWLHLGMAEDRTERLDASLTFAEHFTSDAVAILDGRLREAEGEVRALTRDLGRARVPPSLHEARIRREMERNDGVLAMGYGSLAENADDETPTAFVFGRDAEGQVVPLSEVATEPADPDQINALIRAAVDAGEPVWSVPHWEEAAGALVTEFAAPYVSYSGLEGAVFLRRSVSTLTDFSAAGVLGERGYTYLLTSAGVVADHPNPLFAGRNVRELAAEEGEPAWLEDAADLEEGSAFSRVQADAETGELAWLIYEPESSGTWFVASVIDQDLYPAPPQMQIRRRIHLGLAWMTLFLFAGLFALNLILRRYGVMGRQMRIVWTRSIASSAALMLGLIWVVFVVRDTLRLYEADEVPLLEAAQVGAIVGEVDSALSERQHDVPTKIPTGLVVKSLKIPEVNQVHVAGVLWQKYPLGLPEDYARGVIFADALDPEGVYLEEIYRFEEEDHEVVGFNFRVALRQDLDVVAYPMDQQWIRVELWPLSLGPGFHAVEEGDGEDVALEEDADGEAVSAEEAVVEEATEAENGHEIRGLMLVPDLAGYPFAAPLKQPGLADDLHVEGWSITHSYFSFEAQRFNANFGSVLAAEQRDLTPQLAYTVGIRREYVSPLIAHGVTIIIVLGFMFAVLLVHAETSYNVLTYAAALFFVAVISHVSLRGELQFGGVVFLETFYLMLYMQLLLSSVSALLIYSDLDLPWFTHEESLPRLLYWPVYLSVMLCVALLVFYPRSVPPDPLTNAAQATSGTTSAEPGSEIQKQ